MLTDLDDTRIQHDRSGARLFHATMSGLGPLVGVLVPLTPFLLEGGLLTMTEAGVVAVGLGGSVLGAFGAYIGSIAGQRWYVAALRMALAGLVVAVVNVLLPG